MQIDHALSRRSALSLAGAAGLATLVPVRAAAQNTAAQTASAPAQSATTPYSGFYRLKIGKIEATVLSDGWASMAPLHPMFAPEATREQLEGVLRENFQPVDRAAFEFNPVLLKIGSERVLIDTGSGPGAPTLGRTLANLRAAGTQPDEITAVIITHAHGDHIAGTVQPGNVLTFPNARHFISRAEYAFWTSPAPDLSKCAMPDARKKSAVESAASTIATIDRKLERVAPGDKTLPGLEILDTSGHTPGHISLLVSDGPDQLLIAADLMHNHVIMFARPDWTVAFDTDPRQAASARKRTFDRIAAERLRVLGYHVPWPGLGNIRKHEAGFEWAPEAWSWTA